MKLHDILLQPNKILLSDSRILSGTKFRNGSDFLRRNDHIRGQKRSRRNFWLRDMVIPLSEINDDYSLSHHRITTARRQLSNVDPAYGFSGYFKPVILQENIGKFFLLLLKFSLILFR